MLAFSYVQFTAQNSLRHDDLIARLQEPVLLQFLAVNNLFVVEVVLLAARYDNDLLRVGEFPESAGIHQGLQYGGGKQQRKRSRPADLSLNEVFSAVNLLDLYGDLRLIVRFELRHAVVDRLCQCFRCQSGRLELAQELQSNPSVRPDGDLVAQIGTIPDSDPQDVLWSDHEALGIDGRDTGSFGSRPGYGRSATFLGLLRLCREIG